VSSKSFLNTLNGFKDMDEWVVKPQRERSSAGSMYGGHWFIMKTVLYIFRKKI
jgi:hypothetical protein